jgi:hypothetical protein
VTRPGWIGEHRVTIAGCAAIAAASIVVYRRTISYPFIQDDWIVLANLRSAGGGRFVLDALTPGPLFYRPVGLLYLAGSHVLFGLNPLPHHLLALALHIVNAALVVRIAAALSADAIVGWAAGIIYATAVNVHLASLQWAVGIYELSAVLFSLIAIERCIAGRPVASAICLGLALLSKEAAVFVLPVLVAVELLYAVPASRVRRPTLDATAPEQRSPRAEADQRAPKWPARARRLWPALAVAVLYAGVRAVRFSPPIADAGHPYYVSAAFSDVRSALGGYLRWAVDAVSPLKVPSLGDAVIHRVATSARSMPLVAAAGLGAIGIAGVRARRLLTATEIRVTAIAAVWAVSAMLPVLALPNHREPYYLASALPAICCALVALTLRFVEAAGAGRKAAVCVVAVWAASATASSAAADPARLNLGGTAALLDGRARIVDAVGSQLRRERPALPPGATLVFEGVDVWSFGKDAGPRLWYEDSSLGVVEASAVACERRTLVADHRVLDDARAAWLRMSGGRLSAVALEEVRVSRCGR